MVGDCRADGKWLMWCGCSSRGVCGSVVEVLWSCVVGGGCGRGVRGGTGEGDGLSGWWGGEGIAASDW